MEIEGPADQPVVAVSAHTDTLGLMVRAVKKDGKLAFTRLGGPCLPTLDGEYCRIITRQGKVYTGTILSTAPAVHVYRKLPVRTLGGNDGSADRRAGPQ